MAVMSCSLLSHRFGSECQKVLFPPDRPRLSNNAFVYAVLWISVLRPYPAVLVDRSFGASRILDLITVAFLLLFFMSRLAFNARLVFPRGLALPALVFVTLSVSLPLAFWNSFVLHDEPTGTRDFFELFRFPLMLVTLVFLAQMKVNDAGIASFLERGYVIPFWIVALLCLAEIAHIPVISEMKSLLWGQSKNNIAFSVNYFRISGTLENPNWFSLYLNMILGVFLFFRTKTWSTVGGILTCVCLIALTGSLTGMAGLAFLMVVCFLVNLRRMVQRPLGGMVRLFLVIALIVVAVSGIQQIGNTRVVKRLTLISSRGILNVESANIRVSQALSLVERYIAEPRLLGFGPSKYFIADVIDNQYVEYLMRYGIVGLTLLMMNYGYYCAAALSLSRRSTGGPVKNYPILVCAVTLLLLVYLIAGQFGDIPRLSLVYLGLVVPLFKLAQQDRRGQITVCCRDSASSLPETATCTHGTSEDLSRQIGANSGKDAAGYVD